MTAPKEQSERGTSLLPGEERRRSQRVIIRIPVHLEAALSGEKIKATAHTVAVNIHGAMLLCSRSFDANTLIILEDERSHDRASVRVTRTPRESAEGYLIPVEFLSPAPTFWQISFPSTNWRSIDL